jgi:hypothetical protein
VPAEPALAFAHRRPQRPALEVRVNFGVFAGRTATPAEIDELGRTVLEMVGDVSLVSEQRHELGREAEAALHQVRIELGEDALPRKEGELAELEERLVTAAEEWANACIADRHAQVSEL